MNCVLSVSVLLFSFRQWLLEMLSAPEFMRENDVFFSPQDCHTILLFCASRMVYIYSPCFSSSSSSQRVGVGQVKQCSKCFSWYCFYNSKLIHYVSYYIPFLKNKYSFIAVSKSFFKDVNKQFYINLVSFQALILYVVPTRHLLFPSAYHFTLLSAICTPFPPKPVSICKPLSSVCSLSSLQYAFD